jgi:2-keto-3-deoxy-L-rhamnonate aldolase RhmA
MKRDFGCKHDLKQPIVGPNDFAQSLGYPGQPNHPEVVKTMQESQIASEGLGARCNST